MVRPWTAVSPQCQRPNGQVLLLTFAVRCVLLDLPAQLGHISPTSGTSGLVQLLYVALRFLVLRGVLCCCKLPARTMTLRGRRLLSGHTKQ
jgi:hypothetical protein